MARFLVTGGAGFIGSNIVMKLVEQEHDVVVVDNLSSGREENIDEVKNRIKFVYGDIRNYSTISKAMKGVDYVLHQAAVPSVQRSVIDPVTTHDVNTNGTLNVLLAARDARVKKVVLA
jgi:nucleoside-diphosphate-sugar epimerase